MQDLFFNNEILIIFTNYYFIYSKDIENTFKSIIKSEPLINQKNKDVIKYLLQSNYFIKN